MHTNVNTEIPLANQWESPRCEVRPRHQFMPPFCLRILRIFDLYPADAVTFIDAVFTFRYDAFQIVVADFFEQ
jgi:hypothetical protein